MVIAKLDTFGTCRVSLSPLVSQLKANCEKLAPPPSSEMLKNSNTLKELAIGVTSYEALRQFPLSKNEDYIALAMKLKLTHPACIQLHSTDPPTYSFFISSTMFLLGAHKVGGTN